MKTLKLISLALLGAGFVLPAAAADMNKVLRVAIEAPETGFDPAKVSDVYSLYVVENIFDPLIRYDYLARPVKLVPNTIVAMPTISPDFKVFTFKIKPGIYFSDDSVFKGKKRELTAEDYVYSLKRFADPQINSPTGTGFTDFILGLEEAGKAKGKFDYNAPVAGLKALDRYTLQITLKKPGPNFLYTLASKQAGAVAREAIEAYAKNTNAHPVGTGPFVLKEWKQGNKIVLEANPGFRKVVFDSVAGKDAVDAGIVKALKGKTLPIVGRVEVSVIEETQPRWLSFLNKQLDVLMMPSDAVPDSLTLNPKDPYKVGLKPALAAKGIQLQHILRWEKTYDFFNMADPVVGGYGKDKIALRRAIAMAYPREEVIATLFRGQGVPLGNLIPLGMDGNNPKLNFGVKYDPAAANALLDKFGYKIGADGYRALPNGKPLVVEQLTQSSGRDKMFNEVWQKTFDSIKVRIKFKTAKWNENLKAARGGNFQMWGLGGSASTPDGDDFVTGLWSKGIGEFNYAQFRNDEYDKAYIASQALPHSPERTRLYDQLNKIAAAYQPYILGMTAFRNFVNQSYVKGYKPHPVEGTTWRYLDIQK
ncbi:ABC transporter substrate-binding protein [Xenophilus sp. AP218F]|nr:ABC transporter substrate-binding protein [Chromobacterium sp. ASV5]OWY40142.1 ABC transporter substrate-binding protein [Xenophilus sp. AP218F]